ncbi:hypothetical protein [Lachnospira eligens]|jgi:hypothetical protein|uniref:hypothetical protein n=1 Tax=Lachnospira eligens TaxID=39485 RepID=UPI00189A01B5|nr:hypothetical protein [Lachnospira eligens]
MERENENQNKKDEENEYVDLKIPYLFHIKYNSKQVWDKLPEEEKKDYADYEEYYLECKSIKIGSIVYPLLLVSVIFFAIVMLLYLIYLVSGYNVFSLLV